MKSRFQWFQVVAAIDVEEYQYLPLVHDLFAEAKYPRPLSAPDGHNAAARRKYRLSD
jgi:hypothetical protein